MKEIKTKFKKGDIVIFESNPTFILGVYSDSKGNIKYSIAAGITEDSYFSRRLAKESDLTLGTAPINVVGFDEEFCIQFLDDYLEGEDLFEDDGTPDPVNFDLKTLF